MLPIVIGDSEYKSGTLTIDVNGAPLVISSDEQLDFKVEAIANMFLLPAMAQKRDIKITQPVSKKWLENTQKIMEMASKWWNISQINILANSIEDSSENLLKENIGIQCFTGGLDSLYTGLFENKNIKYFYYVPDFDLAKGNNLKQQENIDHIKKCAIILGKKAIIVRSNLRVHPEYKGMQWEQLHGAALASTASLLSRVAEYLVIPSSFALSNLKPWGSHPDLDPLWEIPYKFQVRHADAANARYKKLEKIKKLDPEYLSLLRVCAQSTTNEINCSKCRKCVRTMIMLKMMNVAEFSLSFNWDTPLESRLKQLSKLPAWGLDNWLKTADEVEQSGDLQIAQAIRSLVQRSKIENFIAIPERWFRKKKKELLG